MLSNCLLKRHHGNWVVHSAEVKLCDVSVQRRLGCEDVGSTDTIATGLMTFMVKLSLFVVSCQIWICFLKLLIHTFLFINDIAINSTASICETINH